MNPKPTRISMRTANAVPTSAETSPLVSSLVTSTRKLSPLFSPQRHPLPPTRSHNQRYPMRSASSFMHDGRESPPLDPRDPTNYWKCCPLIDSASTTYESPLRPPQMAGLPCLRLIDRTSVLTAFPTITYSYRPKRYRFRAHLPQICRLHYKCTRNARR
jgi:hypothetical protein